jgi:hypothetical protein
MIVYVVCVCVCVSVCVFEVKASVDCTSGKTEIECVLAGLHASMVVCVRLLPQMRGVVVDHLANDL